MMVCLKKKKTKKKENIEEINTEECLRKVEVFQTGPLYTTLINVMLLLKLLQPRHTDEGIRTKSNLLVHCAGVFDGFCQPLPLFSYS